LKVFPILGLAHGPMCGAALAPLMSSATNSGLAIFVPSGQDDVIMVIVMVMVMVVDEVIKAGMGLCQT